MQENLLWKLGEKEYTRHQAPLLNPWHFPPPRAQLFFFSFLLCLVGNYFPRREVPSGIVHENGLFIYYFWTLLFVRVISSSCGGGFFLWICLRHLGQRVNALFFLIFFSFSCWLVERIRGILLKPSKEEEELSRNSPQPKPIVSPFLMPFFFFEDNALFFKSRSSIPF